MNTRNIERSTRFIHTKESQMKLFKTLIAITIAIISSTTFACETGGCTKQRSASTTLRATASAAANPTQNLTSSPTATGTASAAANPLQQALAHS